MLGKLYLMGQGVEYDKKLGMYWLSQSAAQGNVYAKALLQRQDSGRPPHVFLAVTHLFHHMSRIFQERSLPQSGTGPQVDSKLRQRMLGHYDAGFTHPRYTAEAGRSGPDHG